MSKVEVYLFFQMETGLENFSHAFLNINMESLLSSENYAESTQNYYDQLYHSARDKNPLPVLTPLQFCEQWYYNEEKLFYECLSTIAAAGCEANSEGNACILHLYLTYKKPDEFYPGSVPGTGGLSDEDLSIAYYRGINYADDYTEENLLKDYYRTTGHFELRSRKTPSSSISDDDYSGEKLLKDYYKAIEHLELRSRKTPSNSTSNDGFERSATRAQEERRKNDLLEEFMGYEIYPMQVYMKNLKDANPYQRCMITTMQSTSIMKF